MRKDQEGDIIILETFWKPQAQGDWETGDCVHPLIVYADLLATADSRNIETARKIYEEKIARYI